MSKPMMVFQGPLTGRIYATSAYKERDNGGFQVTGKKHDITDQVCALMREVLLSDESMDAFDVAFSEAFGDALDDVIEHDVIHVPREKDPSRIGRRAGITAVIDAITGGDV